MRNYINLESAVVLCRPWDNDGASISQSVAAKLDELSESFRVPVGKKKAIQETWRRLAKIGEIEREAIYAGALEYVERFRPKYQKRQATLGKAKPIRLRDLVNGQRIEKLAISHLDGIPCLHLKHSAQSAAHCAPETIEDAQKIVDSISEWIDEQKRIDPIFANTAYQVAPHTERKALDVAGIYEESALVSAITWRVEKFLSDLPRAVALGYLSRTNENRYFRGPINPATNTTTTTIDIDL